LQKSLRDNKFVKILLVAFGSFLLAFGVVYFLAPSHLALGGATGTATILAYLFGGNIGLFIFAINIPIFIIGYISEGKRFLAYSIFGTIMLSIFSQALTYINTPIHDMLLSSIYGGVLSGIGIGLAFLGGGTTGGTDILAKVLNKKFKHISIGMFVIIIDIIVIVAATIVFGKLEIALYSGIGLYISSITIDIILSGFTLGKTAFIITDKPKEIICEIHTKLARGITELKAIGTYSHQEKSILLCSFLANQTPEMKKIVLSIDEHAFMILQNTSEIKGLGFD